MHIGVRADVIAWSIVAAEIAAAGTEPRRVTRLVSLSRCESGSGQDEARPARK
jgi:hypothetical protein